MTKTKIAPLHERISLDDEFINRYVINFKFDNCRRDRFWMDMKGTFNGKESDRS